MMPDTNADFTSPVKYLTSKNVPYPEIINDSRHIILYAQFRPNSICNGIDTIALKGVIAENARLIPAG
jgi:hypothetical protein